MFVEFSSEAIGVAESSYSVAKYSIRKQWALVRHGPEVSDIVAYFRSEDHALAFCRTFGLKVNTWSNND